LQTGKTLCNGINTEFGFGTCTKTVLKKGKENSQNFILDINKEVQQLGQGKTYKCAGVKESVGTRHKEIKERLKKEYTKRLRMILKSEMNAKNKIIAIGALVVPVLRYSFGIINWRLAEIRKIDRETMKTLIMYKIHNPNADIRGKYDICKKGEEEEEARFKMKRHTNQSSPVLQNM